MHLLRIRSLPVNQASEKHLEDNGIHDCHVACSNADLAADVAQDDFDDHEGEEKQRMGNLVLHVLRQVLHVKLMRKKHELSQRGEVLIHFDSAALDVSEQVVNLNVDPDLTHEHLHLVVEHQAQKHEGDHYHYEVGYPRFKSAVTG